MVFDPAAARHRTVWVPPTGVMPGFSAAHTPPAYGQRGWKAQPPGRQVGSGIWPRMGSSFSCFVSSVGIDSNSPMVYGWSGLAKSE